MRLQVLLLLTLLGPSCSLRLVPAKGSLDSPAARARRQAPADEDPEDVEDDDYEYGTDPPELLDKALTTLPHPSPMTGLGTQGQGHPVGARTQEPVPLGAAGSQDAGGAAGSSQEPSDVPVHPTPEAPPTPKAPPATEAPPTPKAPPVTEAPPTPKAPPVTEAPPTQRPPTETTTTKTTPAETTPPATTPAETTPTPSATTTTTTTEAQTTGAAATEVLPHGRAIPETLSTKLPAVADPPTESTTAKAQTTLPAAPGDLTPAPKNRASTTPGGSVTPSSTRAPDHIPVKQCLLAILILALVATVFLVCTVVLAVRLSRKTHMYPLRSYSPTEMVCISSLLPEGGGGGGGEGSGTTANGGPPTGKSADSKVEPGEEREGDDLTLRSFLP